MQAVIRPSCNQQRDRISLADCDGSILRIGGHRAAFVEHLDLPLVIATEQGHGSFECQQIALRNHRAGALFTFEVRDLGAHGQGERTLLISGEPDDDHIVRIGGKILALIGHPALLIGHVCDGFIQTERPTVVLHIVLIKIEIEFGEAGQPALPILPLVVKRLVRDLNTFDIRAAENTGADIAVADGIGPLFPVLIVGIRPVQGLGTLPLTPAAVRRGFRFPYLIGSWRALGKYCQRQTGCQQQINFHCFFHKDISIFSTGRGRKGRHQIFRKCTGLP